jgi:hypothetical protein
MKYQDEKYTDSGISATQWIFSVIKQDQAKESHYVDLNSVNIWEFWPLPVNGHFGLGLAVALPFKFSVLMSDSLNAAY